MTRLIVIAALAASGPVASHAPAAAQTTARTAPYSASVRHADLDLSRLSDIARLDRRIARAAAEACGPVSSLDLAGRNKQARCVQAAATAARPQRDYLVARSGDIRQASTR